MSELKQNILAALLAIILLIILLAIVAYLAFDIKCVKRDTNEEMEKNKLNTKDLNIINKMTNSIVHLRGSGTGFIVGESEEDIYIITNKHVIKMYDLQNQPCNQSFPGNRIFLPYIEFMDKNIQYKDHIKSCNIQTNEKIKQYGFSRQSYYDEMIKYSYEKNGNIINIKESFFGRYYKYKENDTSKENDIALIKIPKSSLNIKKDHKIQIANFRNRNNPCEADETIYVAGNAGAIQETPIPRKGKIIEKDFLTSIINFFRREIYVISNLEILNGHSGSPTFNENGEVIGISTSSNNSEHNIPFTERKILFKNLQHTHSLNNNVILTSIEDMKKTHNLKFDIKESRDYF